MQVFFACKNSPEESGMTRIEVKPNGDSLVATINKKGKYHGPFTAYYHDGNFANGFFKDGLRDSIYKLYWPNGKIKLIAHYIYGKQEGMRYDFELNDSSKNTSSFMRHDKTMIICKSKYSNNDSILTDEYYKNNDSNITYIGALVYRNNSLDVMSSSYYILSYDDIFDNDINIKRNKNSIITIYFLRSRPNTFVDLKIEDIEKNSFNDTTTYSFDKTDEGKSVKIDLKIKSSCKGWHFVTGSISEYIRGEGEKITPLYFNFYVY